MLSLELYKKYVQKNNVTKQLVVNDRLSEGKIMFANQNLKPDNKVMNETAFFMDVSDAYHLCFLILNNRLGIHKPYELVRGKSGKVRSFELTKNNHEKGTYYLLKIDEGTGTPAANGFTSFKKRTGSVTVAVTEEEIEILSLNIQRRILAYEVNGLSKIHSPVV